MHRGAPLARPDGEAVTAEEERPEEIPQPWHRWAINEDPDAPSRYQTSRGRPDHCLTCGIVRYPLSQWAQDWAAGPCPGPQP